VHFQRVEEPQVLCLLKTESELKVWLGLTTNIVRTIRNRCPMYHDILGKSSGTGAPVSLMLKFAGPF